MQEFISISITLFFMLNSLGNIPIFLSILSSLPKERRKIFLKRELFIALIALLLYYFVGDCFMKMLHLKQESISVGGGLILLLIALKMIFPSTKDSNIQNKNKEEPFIVPLAIPLTAGPSAFAMILLLGKSSNLPSFYILVAIFIAWIISAIILLNSTYMFRILGEKGLVVLERLMGMIIVIMSMQMILDGLALTFKIN